MLTAFPAPRYPGVSVSSRHSMPPQEEGLGIAFALQGSSPTFRIPLSGTQSEDFQGIRSFDDSPASSPRGSSSHSGFADAPTSAPFALCFLKRQTTGDVPKLLPE